MQYTGLFRFWNSTRNLILKLKSKKLLIGRYSVIKNVKFESNNSIGDFVNLSNCSIGNHTYISSQSIICNTKMGRFCSVGAGVKIGLGIHPSTDFVSTHPLFYSLRKQSGNTFVTKQKFQEEKEIIVGNDVWIGANAIIIDGIKIGDGAIIAAGAVVTKDVSPYEIVGGVPAKLIRKRFDESKIQFLLESKWWNQSDSWLKENVDKFERVNQFIESNSHQ